METTEPTTAPAAESEVDTLLAERDGWKKEATRLLVLAGGLKSRADDAEAWKDVLRRIDNRFGCSHVDNGPDDADNLGRHINELFTERDKLAKFKAYVHARLDAAGVPVDPESAHKAEGCRIGGRLDYVLAKLGQPPSPDAKWDLAKGVSLVASGEADKRRAGISVYVEGHGDLYPIRGDDGSRMWAVRPEPDAVALDVVFDGDHADLVPGLLLLVSPSPDVARGEPDATRARLAVEAMDAQMRFDDAEAEYAEAEFANAAADHVRHKCRERLDVAERTRDALFFKYASAHYVEAVTAGRTTEGKDGGHA